LEQIDDSYSFDSTVKVLKKYICIFVIDPFTQEVPVPTYGRKGRGLCSLLRNIYKTLYLYDMS
jgi:hypothetical protein